MIKHFVTAAVIAASVTTASFDTIRQVNAGALSIGYAQAGPSNGPVVILLTSAPNCRTASPGAEAAGKK